MSDTETHAIQGLHCASRACAGRGDSGDPLHRLGDGWAITHVSLFCVIIDIARRRIIHEYDGFQHIWTHQRSRPGTKFADDVKYDVIMPNTLHMRTNLTISLNFFEQFCFSENTSYNTSNLMYSTVCCNVHMQFFNTLTTSHCKRLLYTLLCDHVGGIKCVIRIIMYYYTGWIWSTLC